MKAQIDRLLQCPKETMDKLEIIISDNCSTDDTEKVIQEAIAKGFPCNYIKNERNLGMDGNFVSCFKKAKGKYVWLLGDDDYVIIDSLVELVHELEKDDNYGLVHIFCKKERFSATKIIQYNDNDEFARVISYFTTFISANIVQTQYVPLIDFEKYMGTWFTLMPLYITAFIREDKNCLINFPVFEDSKDFKRNGGYNYFEVFVKNFLNVWSEFVGPDKIKQSTYDFIKEDSFKDLIVDHIYDYLLKKKKNHNYSLDNAWMLLWDYYGKNLYAYIYTANFITKRIIAKIRSKCSF